MSKRSHFSGQFLDVPPWINNYLSAGHTRACQLLLLAVLCLLIGCATRPNYTLYPMKPQYVGENIRVPKSVHYLQAGPARQATRLRVKDGLLVDQSDEPLDPSVEDRPNRDGFAIFVMDATGVIYVSFDHQQGRFHHSSLLAGAPVAAAGDMTILNGRLLAISNASGHYRPPPSSLLAVLGNLEALGIDTSKVKVTRIFGSTMPPPNTPQPAQQ